ncbi:aminotransferase class V-fold PLP-dependent enzyme [Arthrobacter alpinus]|nr:aminotransferase class V-fold PLP-dependent enzyme [Arthrobacter alpinus]
MPTPLARRQRWQGFEHAKKFALAAGDEVLVTEMEHHANLIPWQELCRRTGATLRFIPIHDDGTLDMSAAAELITERTKVLAFTHVSNVTGVINPVAELVALAHAVGALVVLDACQSAPHLPLDVKALDVDFAVFSGHKMLAPTGIGGVYGRARCWTRCPVPHGWLHDHHCHDGEEAGYLPAPQRFEAGTQPISQAAALAAACNYLSETGMARIHAWEAELGQRLVRGWKGSKESESWVRRRAFPGRIGRL